MKSRSSASWSRGSAPGRSTLFKTTTADAKHLLLSLLFIPAPDPQAASDWRPLFKLGWTLNYEMFFYALFALAIVLRREYAVMAVTAALMLFVFARPLTAPLRAAISKSSSRRGARGSRG